MGFFLVYVTAGQDLKISARRGNNEKVEEKEEEKKIANLQELHKPFAG